MGWVEHRSLAVSVTAAIALLIPSTSRAAQLDRDGEIRLSVRAYAAARIGTTDTDASIQRRDPFREDLITERRLTFPISDAGDLRQSRYFTEVEWTHKLDRLVREGFGPFSLLHSLPFKLRDVEYKVTYRGEAEGIYDYGPAAYRTAEQFRDSELVPTNIVTGSSIDVLKFRRRLRDIASERHRLFQAYVQAKMPVWPRGTLQLRFGRQILAWGESDVFRLLDNINPLDSSFGGFLIPLDERRVPLDMLVADYYYGTLPGTPIDDLNLQAYAAIDNQVSFYPGVPAGSPWSLPNLGSPSANVITQVDRPARSFRDIRGGARLTWGTQVPVLERIDFSLAHYYTYLDLPAIQLFTNRNYPLPLTGDRAAGSDALVVAVQSAPLVQITGGSTTFLLPLSWVRPLGITSEPVIRGEVAYFRDEPRYTQGQLDPFAFASSILQPNGTLLPCHAGVITADGYCTAGRRKGDSWNAVLGIDVNQWIRWLNPRSSFLITTQFFYKHLNGAAKNRIITTPNPNVSFPELAGAPGPTDGEVLPIPERYVSADWWNFPSDAAEPLFVRSPTDQFLQTLAIATNYYSGRINPALGMIYDWAGTFVLQPQIVLLQDPWRFTVNYSFLAASRLRGGSGISALRDRDNVLFQLEYAL